MANVIRNPSHSEIAGESTGPKNKAADVHNHRLLQLVLLAIVLVGVILRMQYLDRSLWTAEAWVANSVLSDNLAGVFYYPGWLQTTPPLFLLLVRAALKVFGVSNWSLRVVPFALGVLSVVAQARLSGRMFHGWLRLVCTAFVALSPIAIAYSKELKQYSGDLASSVLILIVLWGYLNNPSRTAYRRVLLTFGVLLWLSHPSFMFLPLAVATMFVVNPATRDAGQQEAAVGRIRLKRVLCLLSIVAAEEALNYVLFVKPNVTPRLGGFWGTGFPEFSTARGVVHFYAMNFFGLLIFFFVGFHHAKDGFVNILASPTLLQGLLALGVLAVLGVGYMVVVLCRRNARVRDLAAFACLPVATLVVCNLLHLYPVGARRVVLFLLPCVAIALTIVLEAVWAFVAARWTVGRLGRRLAVLAAVAGIAGAITVSNASDVSLPEESEAPEMVLRYLKSNARNEDLVYVHASVVEPARLYVKMLNWQNDNIVYGDAGWPCCTRHADARRRDQDRALLEAELTDLRTKARGRTVWLVSTGREEHWQNLERKDPDVLAAGLGESGCLQLRRFEFPDMVLDRIMCPKPEAVSVIPSSAQ